MLQPVCARLSSAIGCSTLFPSLCACQWTIPQSHLVEFAARQMENASEVFSRSNSMSFIGSLKLAQEQVRKTAKDPWHLRLQGLRGKIGDDQIERVSSQSIFEYLDVPQRSRAAGACRRLSKLMRLGGIPLRRVDSRQEDFAIRCGAMPPMSPAGR